MIMKVNPVELRKECLNELDLMKMSASFAQGQIQMTSERYLSKICITCFLFCLVYKNGRLV